MSFEEEFPSLKSVGNYGDYVEFEPYYSQAMLSEHCLDKARVREVLNYWINDLDNDWVIRSIKKELGL